jgi:ATP-binding cassette subfamily B protein
VENPDDIDEALTLGVDSIEHVIGVGNTVLEVGDGLLRRLADSGTFVVPTLSVIRAHDGSLAGAERVFNILDEVPEVSDAPDAVELANVQGHVNFTDVCFGYVPNVSILKDISFTAEAGQTIALVGPTGAGKTTIINLLTRFYDIDKGSISIDGLDIRSIRKDSLRRSLGIVLQDTFLFAGKVRENIRYGRLDASDAEVESAARLANADAFIRHLPHGYDTILSDAGNSLSQGQRQLLAIARALLADPAILILDEATSSVDSRTELHIQ